MDSKNIQKSSDILNFSCLETGVQVQNRPKICKIGNKKMPNTTRTFFKSRV